MEAISKTVTYEVIHPISVTLNSDAQQAIQAARKAIADGSTKADAVRMIYPKIFDQPREVVWYCFIAGAELTPRGAITYFYNVKRGFKA